MELWALLYLHNWDPDGKVYPEIHGIYDTWEEARDIRKAMTDPTKYWIRRVRK
jgi:hypothetical protein